MNRRFEEQASRIGQLNERLTANLNTLTQNVNLLGPQLNQGTADLVRRIERLDDNVDESRDRVTEIGTHLDLVERGHENLRQDVNGLTQRQTDLRQEVNRLSEDLTDIRHRIEAIDNTSRHLNEREQNHDHRISAVEHDELNGRVSALQLSLNTADPRFRDLDNKILEHRQRLMALDQLARQLQTIENHINRLDRRMTRIDRQLEPPSACCVIL